MFTLNQGEKKKRGVCPAKLNNRLNLVFVCVCWPSIN